MWQRAVAQEALHTLRPTMNEETPMTKPTLTACVRALTCVLAICALAAPAAHAACMSPAQVVAMANDYMQRQPTPNPEGLSVADGECSRAKFNSILQALFGPPVGYKVGLSNRAVQKRFDYDAPVWGMLYAPMLLRSGETVEAAFGARPLYEADMLVRVSDAAINKARTPMDVLEAIDQVIPFIELPDLMVQSPTPPMLTGAGIVAINVGARLGVMGAPISVPILRAERFSMLDALRDMNIAVRSDGIEVDRGKGTDVLGQPLEAVVWLVQDLARDGRALKPGDLISLGSFSRLLPPGRGVAVEVEYKGLPGNPRVAVNFR
jgi:2-keto-4-pentenoate hydratase